MEEKIPNLTRIPPVEAVTKSHQRVTDWFIQTAPRIYWASVDSPLGRVYLAATSDGLCSVDFGVEQVAFLERLDLLAHLEHDPASLATVERQLEEYFAGKRRRFELAVDLSRLTAFQRSVLHVTGAIQAGSVWTYRQVAVALGNPKASRPVGSALAHNPVPIVIPCHRVIASDGSLGGYSAGAGLQSKRLLLELEGAL